MGTRVAARDGAEAAWRAIVERVAGEVPAGDVADLIRPLRAVELTGAVLRVEAPDRLVLSSLTEQYLPTLRRAAAGVLGARQLVVDVAVGEQGELFPQVLPRRAQQIARLQRAALDSRFTFESFVVGASNQFAHAAARAVAHRPGTQYNPLFLYGAAGLGKTHLLTAIGHEIVTRVPDVEVRYLGCDTFMNDLITSLRRDQMPEFRQRFRQIGVLLLDDVQQLAGRERTQEELFHTFNALHEARRQIVLVGDKLPKEIPNLEERLRNRFEWGLIADIQMPDIETRVAIVERKAELARIPLPHDVALLLAESLDEGVRDLDRCLTRLGAHASLGRHPITLDFARDILDALRAERPPVLSFEQITQAVCAQWSLRPDDLHSRRRSRHIALPRQVAMYLCRRLLGASLPRLGELFDRDHATVLHAVRRTERRLQQDHALRASVERVEAMLRRQPAA